MQATVEMAVARVRALTHNDSSLILSMIYDVEMAVARVRALTPNFIICN